MGSINSPPSSPLLRIELTPIATAQMNPNAEVRRSTGLKEYGYTLDTYRGLVGDPHRME